MGNKWSNHTVLLDAGLGGFTIAGWVNHQGSFEVGDKSHTVYYDKLPEHIRIGRHIYTLEDVNYGARNSDDRGYQYFQAEYV